MTKLVLTLPDISEDKSVSIPNPNGFNTNFKDLGSIITQLLPYILVIAGLVLFILLIIGGFGFLTSGGSPDKMKAAQGKITSAIIGFVIIFISYWLVRILEIMLGIQIF